MQRMRKNLEDVLEEQGGQLSAQTTIAVGVRLLQALHHIHSRGIIHRDLKPQNMMLSLDPSDSHVYLIDFGLSKRYVDPTTRRHVEYAQVKRGLTGTPRYASVSSHIGAEQSRRDDLESLVYILSYLRNGSLPWQGAPGKTKKEKYDNVRKMKQRVSSLRLARGFPPPFVEFVDAVRGLGFKEEPPYERLMHLLKQAAGTDEGHTVEGHRREHQRHLASSAPPRRATRACACGRALKHGALVLLERPQVPLRVLALLSGPRSCFAARTGARGPSPRPASRGA